MSEENGINEEWEALTPEELPGNDELTDPDWLAGAPESLNNRVFDPTAIAGEKYPDGTLGNDITQIGLTSGNKIYGYDGITLGQLLQTGWTWGYQSYTPYTMSKETLNWLRPRITERINDRFYFRDLGASPVARWNKIFLSRLVSKLNELGLFMNKLE